MATIYDVAKIAHTSSATVSYVLNGRGKEKNISEATQKRVLEAAERVNYHPNIAARQLKKSAEGEIRIAVFWLEFYFEQALTAALKVVNDISRIYPKEIDVSLHFFAPGNLKERWERFSPQNYNGIILVGAAQKDVEYIAAQKQQVPILLLNRKQEGFPSVMIDHAAAGRLACDLAYQAGEDSVCTIWEALNNVGASLRLKAFSSRCEELGITIKDQLTCPLSAEGGYEVTMGLIRKKDLKKVIYYNNESAAYGGVVALNESGVKVGKDVYVLSASNGSRSFFRFSTPTIAAIDLKFQEVFELGLRKLLAIISHQDTESNVQILQPEFVYGESFPVMPGL